MSQWLAEHLLITYFIIYVCLTYVYHKVFRARKLPILKEAVIYLLMGVGAFVLFLFQVDLGLPIVACLLFALSLLFIVRIRYFFLDRAEAARQSKRSQ